MTTKRTDHSAGSKPDGSGLPSRKTILACEVGLSLTLSDETLKEFDRIQEEIISAAEKDQKFSWC